MLSTTCLPLTVSDGWNLYSPCEEFGRMGIGMRFKVWLFTDINKDYPVRPPSSVRLAMFNCNASASLPSSSVQHRLSPLSALETTTPHRQQYRNGRHSNTQGILFPIHCAPDPKALTWVLEVMNVLCSKSCRTSSGTLHLTASYSPTRMLHNQRCG